jgi:hypothetical protein
MCRLVVLALAAAVAAPALAQQIYRCVGPDGRITYSDQPPVSGRCANVPPAGGSGPSTVPQSAAPALPGQSLPAGTYPTVGAPGTIPSSAVPAPTSLESTPGRAPSTAGDRLIGVPADEQRREREAVRLNVPQGEAARDAAAARVNVEPGEAARERRDLQVGVPADEARREREAVKLNQ